MNISKITLPPPTLINFYYYFSYSTIIITVLFATFVFYFIKDLKGFKIFILNHSFSLLLLTSSISLIKPIILAPALSGFVLSLLRNDGYYGKSVFIVIGGCILNFCIGLGVTIGARCLEIFPSKITRLLSFITIIASEINLLLYIPLIILGLNNFPLKTTEILSQSTEYDGFFQYFFIEPSLVFIKLENVQHFLIIVFCILLLLIIFAIVVVIILLNHIRTSPTVTSANIRNPLIMTSIIQISFTCLFLILPVLVIVGSIVFQIPKTAGWCTVSLCIICSYSVIDFISTIVFTHRYRKFLKINTTKSFHLQKQTEVTVIAKVPN